VEEYLDGASGSIAKYAVPAQMAVTLSDGEPSAQQLAFSKAATSQFQAEECYRYYAAGLRYCSLNDKKCLKILQPVRMQCSGFAETSFRLVQDKRYEL